MKIRTEENVLLPFIKLACFLLPKCSARDEMVVGLDVVGGKPEWKRPKPLPMEDLLIALRKRVT